MDPSASTGGKSPSSRILAAMDSDMVLWTMELAGGLVLCGGGGDVLVGRD